MILEHEPLFSELIRLFGKQTQLTKHADAVPRSVNNFQTQNTIPFSRPWTNKPHNKMVWMTNVSGTFLFTTQLTHTHTHNAIVYTFIVAACMLLQWTRLTWAMLNACCFSSVDPNNGGFSFVLLVTILRCSRTYHVIIEQSSNDCFFEIVYRNNQANDYHDLHMVSWCNGI